MRPTYWLSNVVAEVFDETSLLRNDLLGVTPSEWQHIDSILAEQGWPQWGHQGCPEMDLSSVIDR